MFKIGDEVVLRLDIIDIVKYTPSLKTDQEYKVTGHSVVCGNEHINVNDIKIRNGQVMYRAQFFNLKGN